MYVKSYLQSLEFPINNNEEKEKNNKLVEKSLEFFTESYSIEYKAEQRYKHQTNEILIVIYEEKTSVMDRTSNLES